MKCENCLAWSNPRYSGVCVRCGRRMTRDRRVKVERTVTALAAASASLPPPDSLDEFADRRSADGPVRQRDFEREAREELADARNYLVWRIEPLWDAHLAGDPQATAVVTRCLRALSRVVAAWEELGR